MKFHESSVFFLASIFMAFKFEFYLLYFINSSNYKTTKCINKTIGCYDYSKYLKLSITHLYRGINRLYRVGKQVNMFVKLNNLTSFQNISFGNKSMCLSIIF